MRTLILLPLVTALLPLISADCPAASPANSQNDDAAAPLFRSFRCPEALPSNEAKQLALREFIKEYAIRFPNNGVRDMTLLRYRLLVSHSCVQTLKSMLLDVSPVSEMLRVGNQDFGPRTQEFNPSTRVWTVWFRKDGEPPALSDEDLIFNFYSWEPATSSEAIAKAFISPRENLHIVAKFTAPDDVTKVPAYFIVSETLYPGESYGYVNITKISSVGHGAYAVTLAKKFTGPSTASIDGKGRDWLLSEEGKAVNRAVGHVGVDPAWEQYLAKAQR